MGKFESIFDILPTRNSDRINEFLSQNPEAIKARDRRGAGPRHWAAYYGIELSIPIPFDTGDRDNYGNTPFHYAALAGRHTKRMFRNASKHTPRQIFACRDLAERRKMMFGKDAELDCN